MSENTRQFKENTGRDGKSAGCLHRCDLGEGDLAGVLSSCLNTSLFSKELQP